MHISYSFFFVPFCAQIYHLYLLHPSGLKQLRPNQLKTLAKHVWLRSRFTKVATHAVKELHQSRGPQYSHNLDSALSWTQMK